MIHLDDALNCSTYLDDALNRIVAMEKEVGATWVAGNPCDAVPRYIYAQESFPYWTNRIGAFKVQLDSQDYRITTYQIMMRLVIGHDKQGYAGALEISLQTTYISQILDYFAQRFWLQSLTYPGAMVSLDPRGAMITNGVGLAAFDIGGIGSKQIGAEFSLEVPIVEQIQQAY